MTAVFLHLLGQAGGALKQIKRSQLCPPGAQWDQLLGLVSELLLIPCAFALSCLEVLRLAGLGVHSE